MSPKTKAAGRARPTFHEVVLEGNPDRVRGLLAGLRLGSGHDGAVYFSHEEGIARASLGERLGRMVGLQASESHVVVDSAMRDLLKRCAKRMEAEAGVGIGGMKRVKSARFEFSYHAYARQYGQEILKLLGGMPSGLKVEGGKPKETVDESARGVEAYSPAHHYEIQGEGAVSGRVDLLVEVRTRLEDHPLVKVGPIELELA